MRLVVYFLTLHVEALRTEANLVCLDEARAIIFTIQNDTRISLFLSFGATAADFLSAFAHLLAYRE